MIWNITLICCLGFRFDLYKFSFCANVKFKDITGIVNYHYHVFHAPQWFYSANKSCSIVFQLYMIPDYMWKTESYALLLVTDRFIYSRYRYQGISFPKLEISLHKTGDYCVNCIITLIWVSSLASGWVPVVLYNICKVNYDCFVLTNNE